MSSSISLGKPSFDDSLGALLVGGLVAMALWGVTCMQTYTHFTRKSTDRPAFRVMIAFLSALDTFDSALNAHILYYYMVTHFLDPLALLVPIWSFSAHVGVTTISVFIIRTMFALRAYRLSNRNLVLMTWIMTISITDLVVGTYITIRAFRMDTFMGLKDLSNFMYFNFAAATLTDLSIAVSLCYLLHKSRTGFMRTDSLISVLIMYAVNTGVIVAVDASLGLVAYVTMPKNLIFFAFYLLLSKLYLNSYLAGLNARETLRDRFQMGDPISVHSQFTPMNLGSNSSFPSIKSGGSRKGIAVHTVITSDSVV
ncbi:hypothetical protein BDN72DRAFT_261893 [Pluteus cervinus]|uniref:Uncharacterized protein n=1 Tax=Pluteus cervinus TaxID=181527 RepID=A0ACD3AF78_9AGAR|nr:hypothetical protein BDN72DRAFT_261893 [Pluteus cervinus]